jgi:hypothetical protein
LTWVIDNVKIDNAFTFGMPEKVFSQSFAKIGQVCVALLELKILPQLSLAKSSVLSIYIVVLE